MSYTLNDLKTFLIDKSVLEDIQFNENESEAALLVNIFGNSTNVRVAVLDEPPVAALIDAQHDYGTRANITDTISITIPSLDHEENDLTTVFCFLSAKENSDVERINNTLLAELTNRTLPATQYLTYKPEAGGMVRTL